MCISKILVPVTGSKRDAVALATAFAAAKPFGAHVKALFCHPDPREAGIPYGEMPIAPEIVQELVDTARDLASAAAKSARGILASTAERAKVRIVAAPQTGDGVSASFEDRIGHVDHCIEETGRLCDLIVFPPIVRSDSPELHDAFVRTLTRTARPVLLSADIAPVMLGQNIAIGWDGGLAAAHALSAALPFLKKARSVRLLSVQSAEAGADVLAEAKDYLALHHVKAVPSIIAQGTRGVAECLLGETAAGGCDMLVVGGYGHSRLAETIFGGVTHDVASHPHLPIFMVH